MSLQVKKIDEFQMKFNKHVLEKANPNGYE